MKLFKYIDAVALRKDLAVCIFLACSCNMSCKKFVTIPPPKTALESATVFTSDATANAAVLGLYTTMIQQGNTINLNPLFGQEGISCIAGLTSDEFKNYYSTSIFDQQAYKNDLNSSFSPYWGFLYTAIYSANAIIDGLNISSGVTPSYANQLRAEARFIRAFCNFYLANIYGDVPLVLSTDYQANAIVARAPLTDVYQQITSDLKYAEDNLATDYSISGDEKTRVNKWGASAMLARVYLYRGIYDSAEAEASAVINNSAMYSLDSLNDVFLMNSNEAIWQLQPVLAGIYPNFDAVDFILPADGPDPANHPVSLSSQLISAFEPGDERMLNWVGNVTAAGDTYYYPSKYTDVDASQTITQYYMMLRLGEQYLVRAEARAQLGELEESADDLNVIRKRAGLANITAGPGLLTAIAHERQVELFTEWGHRWFDLKRTGKVDSVMSIVTPLKGGTWNTNAQLYPIPESEIQLDPNLKQNPGY